MLGRPALYRIEKIAYMTISCQGHADGYDDGEKGWFDGLSTSFLQTVKPFHKYIYSSSPYRDASIMV